MNMLVKSAADVAAVPVANVPAIADTQIDDPVIALADRAIRLYAEFGAIISALGPYEKKMFEWRNKNPMPDLRAGDKAHARWQRRKRDAKRRTGYRTAKAAVDRAGDASCEAVDELLETAPRTQAGLVAKAKAARLVGEGMDWLRLADDIVALAEA